MTQVLSPFGELVVIEDDLLRDFFDEIFVEEKTLVQVLADYKPEHRDKISNYIVFRLAEVNPGYLPNFESPY